MTPRCGRWGWWGWAVLAALGLVGVWQRLTHGHLLANYTSYVPWGLWVSAYIYFMGLSVGLFLLSSLGYVGKVKTLEPIGPLALVISFVALCMALLAVWVDLGHMERFWSVLTRPNFNSLLAWMVWLSTAYLALLLVQLKLALAPQSPKRQRLLALVGTAGVALAIIFHGGEGALFAVVGARPYWNTALLPILFLSGALTSGAALLLAAVAWLWSERGPAHEVLVRRLSRVTLGLLCFNLLLEWAEVSVPLWGNVATETAGLKLVLFGPFWWVFWVLHLLLGTLVPLGLLLRAPADPKRAGLAGALIAVLFMSVRLNVVIPGLAVPLLPGLEAAVQHPRLTTFYVPSLHEWLVLAGVVAIGILLFGLARRFLKVFGEAQEVPR